MAYTFSYDHTNRVTAVTDARGLTIRYQYDALGNRTQMMYPDDANSHLTALTHRDGTGAVIEGLAYTYDLVGKRTTKTDDTGRAEYTYDAVSRLVDTTTPWPALPRESYTYDAVGNRLASTENGVAVFNAGNQLLDDADFTYQYDASGNLTHKTAKADGAVTTYTYDAKNQLLQVASPPGPLVSYTYDAFGRHLLIGLFINRYEFGRLL